MKRLVILLASSKWLKIIALSAALISGIDDLVEAYFGIHDLFGLDAAHGVVVTALTGVLDPLAKLFEQNERKLEKLGDKAGKGGVA